MVATGSKAPPVEVGTHGVDPSQETLALVLQGRTGLPLHNRTPPSLLVLGQPAKGAEDEDDGHAQP
jgi:hypothetical protein